MSHKTGLWVTGAIGLVIASLAMTALTAAVVNGVIQPMKTVRPLDLRCEQVPTMQRVRTNPRYAPMRRAAR